MKGTAELHLKAPLNCEEKKSYQFDIQALSCTGAYSERYVLTYLILMGDSIKSIYSEKAIKFCEISINYLTGSTYIQLVEN